MRKTLIERVVEPGAITAVFQPILDIRGEVPVLHAVEGLSRGPRGSTLETPDVLFEFARRKNEEPLIDRAAIAAILGEARALPDGLAIQVNVHASTMSRDLSFPDYLRRLAAGFGIDLARLTLEILEHSNHVEESRYLAAIESLRRSGVRIALDDVGVGSSNFRMILLTRPSLLKLDRYLIDGIADDAFQQATLKAVKVVAEQAGAAITGEGVEREVDLLKLQELEVEFAQGYLFSRPRPVADLVEFLSSAPFASRPTSALELVAAG